MRAAASETVASTASRRLLATSGELRRRAILSGLISSTLTTRWTEAAISFFFFAKSAQKTQRMASSFVPAPMTKPTAP